MRDFENLYAKDSLAQVLPAVHQQVAAYYAAVADELFFQRPVDGWSAGDNLDHLVKSVKSIFQALRLPRMSLLERFGSSASASRSYLEICQIYIDELAKGAQAGGRYLPEEPDAADGHAAAKARLLERWNRLGEGLPEKLAGWSEEELDQVVLPHPLLGNLSMREMLFFTIYHNLRHISAGGD